MGWAVRDRVPVGTRFSAHPDRPWGLPSLLYNGYRVFPGCRGGRGVGLTPHPYLEAKVLEKSRAIPLLTLRACLAYKKGWKPNNESPIAECLNTQAFIHVDSASKWWKTAEEGFTADVSEILVVCVFRFSYTWQIDLQTGFTLALTHP